MSCARQTTSSSRLRRTGAGSVMYDDHRSNEFDDRRTLCAMRLDQPDRDEIELTAVLHALSDPQRLRIVADARDRRRAAGLRQLRARGLEVDLHPPLPRPARGGRDPAVARGRGKLSSLRRADLEARFPGLLDAVLAPAAVA